jgi:hypothetical protein
MNVLLVTYDLHKPGQDYSDVLKVIKSFPWARLSESSYAIATDKSPDSVFTAIKPYLDANDNVYIINLKRPHSGFGPKDVNAWLDQHLPY